MSDNNSEFSNDYVEELNQEESRLFAEAMENNSEKMVTVPESLLKQADDSIEHAQIYIAALRVISNVQVTSDEAIKLQKVAREALRMSFDYNTLNQEGF